MVLPVAPWPARHNGISIRYYPLIEALAVRHDIDLYVHSEARLKVPDDPLLVGLRKVTVREKNMRPPALTDRLATLAEAYSPLGTPYRFARYHSRLVLSDLEEFIAGRRYDAVLWVMHEYRHLLARLKPQLHAARITYDSIDSPYLHHLREPRPGGVRDAWWAFDLWKTRRWENELHGGVDAAAYISAPDATASADGAHNPPEVIPNGIYLAGEPPPPVRSPTAKSIGFLGNMAYGPNVAGALRLYSEVFTPLKREFTDLRLVIIGRAPVEPIRALSATDVDVTGTVNSIWPHIANVGVFVYPMTEGAGLQNKILEAMHAGKPVVTTEICLNSVGAREGVEILVGRNDEELRTHTRRLLRDPDYARELGLRGKAYVDRTFDMAQVVQRFERFLIGDEAPGEPDQPS
jgi:glycosyltransferase involved in cell wall biosynthesis